MPPIAPAPKTIQRRRSASELTGADGTVLPMDVVEARRLLGVDDVAGPDELRGAFRDALRRTHPDLHGGDGDDARRVLAAYELLAGLPAPAPAPAPAPLPPTPVTVDGDTVSAELPAGDLFEMLVAVGDDIGEVTYLDAEGGLLEVLLQVPGHGPCSVVLSLQGRGLGFTEAMCTVEPVGSWPAPPPEVVAAVLADALRTVSER